MTDALSPYFGEPKIQALQKARDEQVPELIDRNRPGSPLCRG